MKTLPTIEPYPGIREIAIAPRSNPSGEKEVKGVVPPQVRVIRLGIPAKAFVRTAKRIGLSRDQLAKKLGLKPRTIAARLASGRKLRPDETEKVLRVTHALDLASEAFGSETDAKDWLTSPARGLDYQRPIDLLDTEPGNQQVLSYLTAIRHGNYW